MMLTVNGGDLQAGRSLAAARSRQASVITPNACLSSLRDNLQQRRSQGVSLSACW
jgi:hypothetical protein